MVYPAAGIMPHLLFGLPAEWLGAPRLGLIGYLLALTIAVVSPAVSAAGGHVVWSGWWCSWRWAPRPSRRGR